MAKYGLSCSAAGPLLRHGTMTDSITIIWISNSPKVSERVIEFSLQSWATDYFCKSNLALIPDLTQLTF